MFALDESLYKFDVANENSFKKFEKNILDYKPEKNLLDDQKEMAKRLKDKYKAKKAELILLDNDKYYYRLIFNNNKVMLCSEDGFQKAMPYPSSDAPANSISLIQIEGDNDYYFMTSYDSMDYKSSGLVLNGYSTQSLFSPEGRSLCTDCVSARAVVLDGVKYISCTSLNPQKNIKEYKVSSPEVENLFCFSDTPIFYAPAVSDGTENLKGDIVKQDFNIRRNAHPACLISSREIIVLPEYKSTASMYLGVPLGNSGWYIRCMDKSKTKLEPSVVIYEGNTVSGQKITFNGQYENTDILDLFDFNGNNLLKRAVEISFSEPDDVIYYTKKDKDGNIFTGAVCLQDTTVNIPAKFINASIIKGADGSYNRFVSLRPFEDMVVYDNNIEYDYVPSSNTEKYFVARRYYKSFTQDNKLNDADHFSEIDLKCKLTGYLISVSEALAHARKVQEKYLNGIEPVELTDPISMEYQALLNIDLFSKKGRDLKLFCERYLEIVPDSRKDEVLQLVEKCKNLDTEMSKFQSDELPKAKETFAQIKLKQKLEQEELERQRQLVAERERLLQQQQQAAYAQAFLAGFANLLGNIINTAIAPAPSKVSKGGYNVSSAPVSSGGSRVSSSEPHDNTDHKIWVNNKRIDLERKLEKAYKQLEHATESYNKNPSATTKNLLESSKKYYEEIQRELRELK